jgi:uncharacterized membrane protein
MKKNLRTAVILFLIAGMAMAVCGLLMKEERVKQMFLILATAFLLSGVVQFMVYRRKPGAFKDRPVNPD